MNISGAKRFIGFDIGAESGRCVVAVLQNELIELNEVHRFATHNYHNSLGFHWNINAIFDEIILGLQNAKKEFGDNFESIGIDTWGVDYALIDENGKLINDPFHYRDDRTDNIMEEVFSIVDKKSLFKYTGTQFQQFNTIFQLFAERKNDPAKLSSASKMLLIPDYLNYLLSGKTSAEYTIASTTGLVNPLTRNWSWELIEKLEFPKNIFPKIIEPGTELGKLLPQIANETGLSEDILIIASAGHDTAAAVVSVPAEGSNWTFLSSGTWSLMGTETEEPILNDEAMKYNFTNEGGVENTIRFLKNIIGLWPIQECRRSWVTQNSNYSYPELTKLAENIGYVYSWINLNDIRFLKAGDMPNKVLAYLSETNQNGKDDVAFIIRVLLESLAFTYKVVVEEIEQIQNEKIDMLNMIGGGIQNELLCQLTADALNLTVVAGPIEGTIIGNIGVQAITNKSVEDLIEWRKIVSNSFELKVYSPKNPNYFEKNKNKFSEVCRIQ